MDQSLQRGPIHLYDLVEAVDGRVRRQTIPDAAADRNRLKQGNGGVVEIERLAYGLSGVRRKRMLAEKGGDDEGLRQAGAFGDLGVSAESLVLLSAEFATRDQIDRFCHQHSIQPHVRIEANSISAVIEIVRRTQLSTLLPATIAFAHQDLKAITLDPVLLQRTAVLMQRKDAYRSAATKAFVALAKEVAAGL
ncbi:hypothetical protein GCM10007920_34890 [Ciceribacter naphthalenivorans]|uniref:LysR substrate-binding domain-containing protein n=3 Tax=Pseudomonadota TaxID=1224 RepID=A0A512HQ74_9HYPH|nr:hypothetical protein RNA01_45010 [Ciceribacter naphthalenivorans]GLR23697.1 hypothetical protein GCM10007920_34890 [Ciceribacter naphthalenivorans]GLT06553.1 hypothetical protein GCM10007926_34890 [Sphingomonas psychrolutea]